MNVNDDYLSHSDSEKDVKDVKGPNQGKLNKSGSAAVVVPVS